MKADEVSSVICLIFGVVTIYFSKRLGLGSVRFPGPGFTAFCCGVMLSGLSMVIFLRSRITNHGNNPKRVVNLWVGLNWSKPVIVILALFTYSLAFTHLGFLISTTALLIFLFRGIDPVRWIVAIGSALLVSVLSFVIFALLLKVQLPYGMIEKLLFY